jgi:hypothetical protein
MGARRVFNSRGVLEVWWAAEVERAGALAVARDARAGAQDLLWQRKFDSGQGQPLLAQQAARQKEYLSSVLRHVGEGDLWREAELLAAKEELDGSSWAESQALPKALLAGHRVLAGDIIEDMAAACLRDAGKTDLSDVQLQAFERAARLAYDACSVGAARGLARRAFVRSAFAAHCLESASKLKPPKGDDALLAEDGETLGKAAKMVVVAQSWCAPIDMQNDPVILPIRDLVRGLPLATSGDPEGRGSLGLHARWQYRRKSFRYTERQPCRFKLGPEVVIPGDVIDLSAGGACVLFHRHDLGDAHQLINWLTNAAAGAGGDQPPIESPAIFLAGDEKPIPVSIKRHFGLRESGSALDGVYRGEGFVGGIACSFVETVDPFRCLRSASGSLLNIQREVVDQRTWMLPKEDSGGTVIGARIDVVDGNRILLDIRLRNNQGEG